MPDGSELARLTLSNVDSVKGGPLVSFGGHSFSIRDTAGRIVFDSGSQLDREAIRLGIYDDGRSDNMGVEPEGLTAFQVGRRYYVAVAHEVSDTTSLFEVSLFKGRGHRR